MHKEVAEGGEKNQSVNEVMEEMEGRRTTLLPFLPSLR